MGTVFAAASALAVTTAGAAAALSAHFGAAGNGGQYLAGHVLLGLGFGHSLAILVRAATRRLVARRSAGMEQAGSVAAPVYSPAHMATVTVLPARPPVMAPLRGKHAA